MSPRLVEELNKIGYAKHLLRYIGNDTQLIYFSFFVIANMQINFFGVVAVKEDVTLNALWEATRLKTCKTCETIICRSQVSYFIWHYIYVWPIMYLFVTEAWTWSCVKPDEYFAEGMFISIFTVFPCA